MMQRGGDKLGYESEAFAIHDLICHCIKPPVYTVCIGNAFGEAAMLLAAGVVCTPQHISSMSEPVADAQ